MSDKSVLSGMPGFRIFNVNQENENKYVEEAYQAMENAIGEVLSETKRNKPTLSSGFFTKSTNPYKIMSDIVITEEFDKVIDNIYTSLSDDLYKLSIISEESLQKAIIKKLKDSSLMKSIVETKISPLQKSYEKKTYEAIEKTFYRYISIAYAKKSKLKLEREVRQIKSEKMDFNGNKLNISTLDIKLFQNFLEVNNITKKNFQQNKPKYKKDFELYIKSEKKRIKNIEFTPDMTYLDKELKTIQNNEENDKKQILNMVCNPLLDYFDEKSSNILEILVGIETESNKSNDELDGNINEHYLVKKYIDNPEKFLNLPLEDQISQIKSVFLNNYIKEYYNGEEFYDIIADKMKNRFKILEKEGSITEQEIRELNKYLNNSTQNKADLIALLFLDTSSINKNIASISPFNRFNPESLSSIYTALKATLFEEVDKSKNFFTLMLSNTSDKENVKIIEEMNKEVEASIFHSSKSTGTVENLIGVKNYDKNSKLDKMSALYSEDTHTIIGDNEKTSIKEIEKISRDIFSEIQDFILSSSISENQKKELLSKPLNELLREIIDADTNSFLYNLMRKYKNTGEIEIIKDWQIQQEEYAKKTLNEKIKSIKKDVVKSNYDLSLDYFQDSINGANFVLNFNYEFDTSPQAKHMSELLYQLVAELSSDGLSNLSQEKMKSFLKPNSDKKLDISTYQGQKSFLEEKCPDNLIIKGILAKIKESDSQNINKIFELFSSKEGSKKIISFVDKTYNSPSLLSINEENKELEQFQDIQNRKQELEKFQLFAVLGDCNPDFLKLSVNVEEIKSKFLKITEKHPKLQNHVLSQLNENSSNILEVLNKDNLKQIQSDLLYIEGNNINDTIFKELEELSSKYLENYITEEQELNFITEDIKQILATKKNKSQQLKNFKNNVEAELKALEDKDIENIDILIFKSVEGDEPDTLALKEKIQNRLYQYQTIKKTKNNLIQTKNYNTKLRYTNKRNNLTRYSKSLSKNKYRLNNFAIEDFNNVLHKSNIIPLIGHQIKLDEGEIKISDNISLQEVNEYINRIKIRKGNIKLLTVLKKVKQAVHESHNPNKAINEEEKAILKQAINDNIIPTTDNSDFIKYAKEYLVKIGLVTMENNYTEQTYKLKVKNFKNEKPAPLEYKLTDTDFKLLLNGFNPIKDIEVMYMNKVLTDFQTKEGRLEEINKTYAKEGNDKILNSYDLITFKRTLGALAYKDLMRLLYEKRLAKTSEVISYMERIDNDNSIPDTMKKKVKSLLGNIQTEVEEKAYKIEERNENQKLQLVQKKMIVFFGKYMGNKDKSITDSIKNKFNNAIVNFALGKNKITPINLEENQEALELVNLYLETNELATGNSLREFDFLVYINKVMPDILKTSDIAKYSTPAEKLKELHNLYTESVVLSNENFEKTMEKGFKSFQTVLESIDKKEKNKEVTKIATSYKKTIPEKDIFILDKNFNDLLEKINTLDTDTLNEDEKKLVTEIKSSGKLFSIANLKEKKRILKRLFSPEFEKLVLDTNLTELISQTKDELKESYDKIQNNEATNAKGSERYLK